MQHTLTMYTVAYCFILVLFGYTNRQSKLKEQTLPNALNDNSSGITYVTFSNNSENNVKLMLTYPT